MVDGTRPGVPKGHEGVERVKDKRGIDKSVMIQFPEILDRRDAPLILFEEVQLGGIGVHERDGNGETHGGAYFKTDTDFFQQGIHHPEANLGSIPCKARHQAGKKGDTRVRHLPGTQQIRFRHRGHLAHTTHGERTGGRAGGGVLPCHPAKATFDRV